MTDMVFEDRPHAYEIIIDEELVVIYFSLHPDLNSMVMSLIRDLDYGGENKRYVLEKYIAPNDKGWGYGKIIKRSDRFCDNGWITWECKLPRKASPEKLLELNHSINLLSVFVGISETKIEPSLRNQLLEIDYLSTCEDQWNGGGFSFTYSKEVLDFNKYWVENEPKVEQKLLDCMQKIYVCLSGKKLSSSMKYDFNIGLYQQDVRRPTFRVPGNCACIGPSNHMDARYPGTQYSPHNVDTKLQQISLLAGVIKLANLAREYYNQKNMK